MIGVFSKGIASIPGLDKFLGDEWVKLNWWSECNCTRVVGWGQGTTTKRAQKFAKKHGLQYISLEDGFLRSVGLGRDDAPLSIIFDEIGVYYRSDRASSLEIAIGSKLSDADCNRARNIQRLWCANRLSKYNHTRDPDLNGLDNYVLVVDQTWGDNSVKFGSADKLSFERMLASAIFNNPGSRILVKIHPDVLAGYKTGYFDPEELAKIERVTVVASNEHPSRLIENAKAIYVVTSQLGFEGLLWGKPVHTFGMPFYAGWGLTTDNLVAPARRSLVSLEQLVFAAFVKYSRYIHPDTGESTDVEMLMDWMGLQRRMRARFPIQLNAFGFSLWKRPFVRDFLAGSNIVFHADTKFSNTTELQVWWGRKGPVLEDRGGPPILRIEDGFLRSVGLGAELIRPLSWVIDDLGIYYDARVESRLEQTLRNYEFDRCLLDRAKKLRHSLLKLRITKYNLSAAVTWVPPRASGQRLLLVVGQVESDASLKFGSNTISTNIDLLIAVRARNPDAYIAYKPHPDVAAGLREAGVNERCAIAYCNEILGRDIGFELALDSVDEVHVMTSLGGFEGLIRGKRVVTYGQPFYAGWGLTQDFDLTDDVRRRRNRSLSLDELVAATLIIYPTYVSRITKKFTTVENIVAELVAWRGERPQSVSYFRKIVAYFFRKQ